MTLRIRIIAPREDRVRAICQERKLVPRKAESEIDESSRDQIAFVKEHFHKDTTDPAALRPGPQRRPAFNGRRRTTDYRGLVAAISAANDDARVVRCLPGPARL